MSGSYILYTKGAVMQTKLIKMFQSVNNMFALSKSTNFECPFIKINKKIRINRKSNDQYFYDRQSYTSFSKEALFLSLKKHLSFTREHGVLSWTGIYVAAQKFVVLGCRYANYMLNFVAVLFMTYIQYILQLLQH